MSQHARDLIRKGLDNKSHDEVIAEYARSHRAEGKTVYTNPGQEKNKAWNDCFIDVIVLDHPNSNSAIVIEVETDSSLTDTEAKVQWVRYAECNDGWHLAVPVNRVDDARRLLLRNYIENCRVVAWESLGVSDRFELGQLPRTPLSPRR